MTNEQRQQLGHKAMNLYQIEMNNLPQSSELITIEPDETLGDTHNDTVIFVKNENLLYRIHQFNKKLHIGCMNFASPIEPGGGFLQGIDAQEEAICRNSFLYPELCKYKKEYYIKNIQDNNNYFYSPSVIYAHNVKVIRDEHENNFFADVRFVDFASVAAPNVAEMKRQHLQLDEKRIEEDILKKVIYTLRIFKQNAIRYLILGAFGCGVFGNDPQMVAKVFKEVLQRDEFKDSFLEIYFDILDNSKAYQAFKKTFK